jgi:hypothetical protein
MREARELRRKDKKGRKQAKKHGERKLKAPINYYSSL